jgi:hypothetical protein
MKDKEILYFSYQNDLLFSVCTNKDGRVLHTLSSFHLAESALIEIYNRSIQKKKV